MIDDLSPREEATILDALLAYVERLRLRGGWGVIPIMRADHFNEVEPLTPEEIDRLYARLRRQVQGDSQTRLSHIRVGNLKDGA